MRPLALALLGTLWATAADAAWRPPPTRDEGWAGTLALGAQRFTGNTRAESVWGGVRLGYARGRFEGELSADWLTASAQAVVERLDDDGEPVPGADGLPELAVVRTRTHERAELVVQPRWFWTERVYQFALLSARRDAPAGIERARRTVGGAGYKLWRGDTDYLAGEIGAGVRDLRTDVARSSGEPIGYAALRLVRRFESGLRLDGAIDAELTGNRPLAEASLAASLPLAARLALKLEHVERWKRDRGDPRNPLRSATDGTTTLGLELTFF